MIPTIEAIVEDLAAGLITKQQAIEWLHLHAADAGRELRDDFAAAALSGMHGNIGANQWDRHDFARKAYEQADAMLRARQL